MARYLLLTFALLSPLFLLATHNRAGEIVVEYVGECGSQSNQVCITVITYTERFSMADRDSLDIDWDDGSDLESAPRTAIIPINGQIQRNEYTLCHNYSGPGRYFINTTDPNRIGGILNVNFPNSINVRFSIYTIYNLTNPAILGCNSSPVLEAEPLDRACVGEVWTHNPGAFDPDGDSLAFEFTVPLDSRNVPVPGYVFPNEVGGIGSLDIDRNTGQITWDSPNLPGEYNLAFLVISYRNGQPLDTMIRDMQILVEDCNNDPPEIIKDFEEICVVAGELIEFPVTATAPLTDLDQLVSLRASGGPFIVPESPASFNPSSLTGFEEDPVTRTFRWQTTCSHISNQPYFVVFRAEDNFFGDSSGLTTIQTVSIRVVAPPPQDLQAEEEPGLVTLTWELPYDCEMVEAPTFEGFSVWRRLGSNDFPIDTCETGLDGRGYERLTPTPVQEIDGGRYIFFDETVERGRTYCYRVLAEFTRRAPLTGLIFEDLESIPSEEICVQLPRDIPLLTKVDVTNTGTTNGSIDICWIKPEAAALDTTINEGPYTYVLSWAEGLSPAPADFATLETFEIPFFASEVDTCFTHNGLDTESLPYSYRIEFFVGDETEPVEEGLPASSVRLDAAPTDDAVNLSWQENVPWTNFAYDIFRRLPGATTYDSLTTVADPFFLDEGLENGLEYCYFVRSVGSYGVDNIPSPLLNRSQEVCVVPFDNVAPCSPVLAVSSICDRGGDCTVPSNLFNALSWSDPTTECNEDDVAGFRVYYSTGPGLEAELVGNIESNNRFSFDHSPPDGIIGCYFVTAVDVNGNESEPSNEVCVSACPFYELPNAFTPNGDNQNDVFRPRGSCFIDRVEFQVFNRWGQLVFETEDPSLNWDGTNMGGAELASGTYYYVCRVFEQRLEGPQISGEPLKGYIELLRGR